MWVHQNTSSIQTLLANASLTLFLAVSLAGCATPYQSTGLLGGLTETRLSEDVWEINFRGNGFTDEKKAKDFALLRSAELTLQNGFSYFMLINSATDKFAGATGVNVLAGGVSAFIPQPSTTNTVQMYKAKPDTSPGMVVYDASDICNSFGSRYGITCDKSKGTG